MFYDKKCNFYKRNQVTEDFVEKTVYTLLHENVDCDFFTTQLNNGEYEMESAKYEDGQLYIVVLP
ncbi:MAG: hypothetical protein LBG59_07885 [Candidatus Peribacteria bacterium]|jgi:hypothetical protein|nr:hypothetical protein [Candidatus Peribacteria bacterium]